MVAGSLLGLAEPTFVKSNLLVIPDQIIYLGLSDDNDNLDLVKEYGIQYYTDTKMNMIGSDNIVNSLKNIVGDRPVYVTLDMKVYNKQYAPSVIDPNSAGLEPAYVDKILETFKNNIVGFDITEFNPFIGTKKDAKITRETARDCIKKLFDLKEKNINIFSEDSEFLIYRPLSQENDKDYGWYILRGLTLDQREDIIKKISIDEIVTIPIGEDDFLVTKTTINEQNSKSYHTVSEIQDIALFPDEKIDMGFELLNTTAILPDSENIKDTDSEDSDNSEDHETLDDT
jgi:hypothetical protein